MKRIMDLHRNQTSRVPTDDLTVWKRCRERP